jgi:hypothetical protein
MRKKRVITLFSSLLGKYPRTISNNIIVLRSKKWTGVGVEPTTSAHYLQRTYECEYISLYYLPYIKGGAIEMES